MQILIKIVPTIWVYGLIFIVGLMRANGAVTEPYGLYGMAEFERLPYLKLDAMAGGASSFDRTAHNGDFSQFLYTNGTEKVLLDLKGPGTVDRIWFTGFNPERDWIKVYFDDEAQPRINRMLRDMFAGVNEPFLSPLVGNDFVSSGGFYCYLPLPFAHSIRIESDAISGSFYYNIGYRLYAPGTAVTTWTGKEDSGPARELWFGAGSADPKGDLGNTVVSQTFDLSPDGTKELLDLAGPNSIFSIKLRVKGLNPPLPVPTINDSGRAHKGFSQFKMSVNANNHGATLVRRMDYGIGNQVADVYVDDALAGRWSTPGSDPGYNWRDSKFEIPATFTTNKSAITIKVKFVSSDVDWNEFYYWIYSTMDGTNRLTDELDVGSKGSERAHEYVIKEQGWSGDRTFQYPPAGPIFTSADLLTNLWLSISYDDDSKPGVFAPIGSFFAMGQFAPYPTRSLPVGMDGSSNLYCYFPMPFAHRARVQLLSQRAEVTTNVQCEIAYKPFKGSFKDVGYFKTQFRSETPTTNGIDIGFLETEGAGHLVGVVESMMGPRSRAYLEGNERFYIDDSFSPAISGTGTEDFYNSGWYFNHGTFSLPTHGNPVHLSDTKYDYTTAYRLFLGDAIPFRKHIRAGIEHGPEDDVQINAWTIAYYYHQSGNRAVLTDQLSVGDAANEAAHSYKIKNQTWSGSQKFSYEWQGNFSSLVLEKSGRAHQGRSQFKMALQPANEGAILRRQFDQGIFNQDADVYVDGALVGRWYRAGGNNAHRWRDDDFMIPAKYTKGKKHIKIMIEHVPGTVDWTEFTYSLYSLTAGEEK